MLALHCRWSLIASQLERRTDNDVKNHWNTKLKKRLAAASAPAAAAVSSARSPSFLPLPAPAPAATAPAPVLAMEPVPTHPSLLSLAVPPVKTEMYTCDDFLLAPAALRDPFAEGSTSASAASSASNWSADNGAAAAAAVDGGGGFFVDFCTGSDLGAAAADQFLGGFYYPLDPTVSLV